MTDIGPITIPGLRVYSYGDYGVTLEGWVTTLKEFEEIKELFALSRDGSAVQAAPGCRPEGFDHTEDSLNTRFCEFTTQEIMKPKTGWYLLTGFSHGAAGRVPRFLFRLSLFFLGTEAHYQPGYKMKSLEKATNDWNI